MTLFLGSGGESIVLSKETKGNPMALKLSPEDSERKNKYSELPFDGEFADLQLSELVPKESVYKDSKPNELAVKNLKHKNIIEYIDSTFEIINETLFHITGKFYYLTKKEIFIFYLLVMPRYDTTLWNLFQSDTIVISPKSRIQILSEILNGIVYIQSKNLCHLDLKLSNIMINHSNNTWDGKTLVIADFGLSTSSNELTGRGGTPGFGSPEQFIGKPNLKSDNFAFGKISVLTLFEWNTGWNILAKPIQHGKSGLLENDRKYKGITQIIKNLLSVS